MNNQECTQITSCLNINELSYHSTNLLPSTFQHSHSPGTPCMGTGPGMPPRQGICPLHSGWHPIWVLDRFLQRSLSPVSCLHNMPSAELHPQVVTDYITKKLTQGRLIGPIPDPYLLPSLHISRFGVIPKGHNTGKWRLITDLSYPPGVSVNNGIDKSLCSLEYMTVDDVAHIVHQIGRGAQLAKIDIESAYRLIPVHPQDRPLQAVRWQTHTYVDPMLPFGLRSAPKIFNAVFVLNAADSLLLCTNLSYTQ